MKFNINEFIQKLTKNKKLWSSSKYISLISIISINFIFIDPEIRKFYSSLYSNKADITHIVISNNLSAS